MKKTKRLFLDHWLKALESGNYRQGFGVLRDGRNYCCLGVACAVFNKMCKEGTAGLAKQQKLSTNTDFTGTYHFDDEDIAVPNAVKAAIGLDLNEIAVKLTRADVNKMIKNRKHHYSMSEDELYELFVGTTLSLAEINDTQAFSFKDIAALIRRAMKIKKETKNAPTDSK